MRCPYCQTDMEQFTESFIFCPNMDEGEKKCPHRRLDAKDRKGARTRAYCIEGKIEAGK